jgi:hypothetical protein
VRVCRRDRWRCACENCILRQADQFSRVGFEETYIACGKAVVDPDIFALDPPETPQRIRKGRHNSMSERVVLRETYQHANTAKPLSLLCMTSERPSCSGPENSDELAPPQ